MNTNDILEAIEAGQRFRRLHELVKNRYINHVNKIYAVSVAAQEAQVKRFAGELADAATAEGYPPLSVMFGGLHVGMKWSHPIQTRSMTVNLGNSTVNYRVPPTVEVYVPLGPPFPPFYRKMQVRYDETPLEIFRRVKRYLGQPYPNP